MIFKHTCPTCGRRNKMVSLCKLCMKKVCKECSFDGECFDCYTHKNKKVMIDDYFLDKYTEVNV